MDSRDAALQVIKTLRASGFEALLAGGCVRDMLLGLVPKDYDVVTSALPHQVIGLFHRTLKVGAKFGVVIVLIDSHQIEVATFRQDMGYNDGRRPTGVRFSGAREDALRRDFTINGLFYDPLADQVIDYVDGKQDLERKVIRTIGPPEQRFSEDYLRMLRAIRFSSQLGFSIDTATYQGIVRYSDRICQISGERISMELEGILTSRLKAKGLRLMVETGLARAIFPRLDQDLIERGSDVLAYLRGDVCYPLALAAMAAFIEIDAAIEAFESLRLSRSQIRHVRFLLVNRGQLCKPDISIGPIRLLLAEPYFWDLFELQRAIQKATAGPLDGLIRVRRMIRSLKGTQIKPRPLLDGYDLMRLGIEPGPELGRIAQRLYMAQLEGLVKDRQQAQEFVIGLLGRSNLT